MTIDRRQFLKVSAAAGGGLALQFSMPVLAAPAKGLPPTEVNAWVVIHPDDRVSIRIARSEMGQGTLTGLAQLVAEELECDWKKVTTENITAGRNYAAKRAWGDMAAVGSRTIRNSQEYLRKAGAGAREMLVSAAATRWGVPAGECVAVGRDDTVLAAAALGGDLREGRRHERKAVLPAVEQRERVHVRSPCAPRGW